MGLTNAGVRAAERLENQLAEIGQLKSGAENAELFRVAVFGDGGGTKFLYPPRKIFINRAGHAPRGDKSGLLWFLFPLAILADELARC
jgi:hypothetical protein